MRTHLVILAVAAAGLSGCTAFDEAVYQDRPVHAPGNQAGYVVSALPGETVESLARRFDVPSAAVIQANHLQAPYTLRPQQTLIIPPPATYRVRSGDTVAGIATMLGVDEVAFARANGLEKPYHMQVNQVLRVPGGFGGEEAATASEEPGFTGVEPPPRSTISAEPLAPPPGISQSGTGFAQPTPPPAAPAMPASPTSSQHQPLPSSSFGSPTALAPQQPSRPLPPVPPAAATGAPTAIIPSTPAGSPPAAVESVSSAPQVTPPARTAPAQTAMASPISPAGAPHFIKPVSGSVTLGFGADASGQTNDGLNISAPSGTPVQAAEAGTVIYTGNELQAFGNLVLIRHAGGWVTAYGHLGSIAVQRGATVTQGQPIGTVGQTGNATAPQLHFEIRQGSKPVDPAPLLSSAKG